MWLICNQSGKFAGRIRYANCKPRVNDTTVPIGRVQHFSDNKFAERCFDADRENRAKLANVLLTRTGPSRTAVGQKWLLAGRCCCDNTDTTLLINNS